MLGLQSLQLLTYIIIVYTWQHSRVCTKYNCHADLLWTPKTGLTSYNHRFDTKLRHYMIKFHSLVCFNLLANSPNSSYERSLDRALANQEMAVCGCIALWYWLMICALNLINFEPEWLLSWSFTLLSLTPCSPTAHHKHLTIGWPDSILTFSLVRMQWNLCYSKLRSSCSFKF